MTEPSGYRVVSYGSLLPGYQRAGVIANLRRAFGLSDRAMEALLADRRTSIKSGLTLERAAELVRRFERLGVGCMVEDARGDLVELAAPDPVPKTQELPALDAEPAADFSLVAMETRHRPNAQSVDLQACPKCGAEQPRERDTCASCGVIFQRYYASLEAARVADSDNAGAHPSGPRGAVPVEPPRRPGRGRLALLAVAVLVIGLLGAHWALGPDYLVPPKLVLYQTDLGVDYCVDATALESDPRAGESDPKIAALLAQFDNLYGGRYQHGPFFAALGYRVCVQEYVLRLANLGQQPVAELRVRYNVPLLRQHVADRRPVNNLREEVDQLGAGVARAPNPRIDRLPGEGLRLRELAPGTQVTLRLFAWYREGDVRKSWEQLLVEVVADEGLVTAGDPSGDPLGRLIALLF